MDSSNSGVPDYYDRILVFVLLIGGVNVANLALVRTRARLKELVTRLALGAGRAQVARQLVVESVVLTLVLRCALSPTRRCGACGRCRASRPPARPTRSPSGTSTPTA